MIQNEKKWVHFYLVFLNKIHPQIICQKYEFLSVQQGTLEKTD